MSENLTDFSKHIFIIGNGVIAKALAVALTIHGRKVTILRGSVEEQDVYQQNIEVQADDITFQADVTISSISHYEKLDGIILLTNKSFGNPGLAEKLISKTNHSPIVFLQNGLQIENSFTDKDYTQLYRCVLMATSQSITENKVRFKPVASSPVGIIKGSSITLDKIVEEISTDIFSFRSEADIQTLIWKKVISNCVFNSICPLLETDNGIFHRNGAALEMAKKVIGECIEIAEENSIHLTMDSLVQNVLNLSKMSDGQKISTYQDILNKRETEIETLNLAIARIASVNNRINVPVTALLGELIKIKSEISRSQING
ncbi:ketopantoate reductase family protein [Dyadobacter sp. NIV53]|uniref:ketopantoate reductase family protein n=1 Tax=Dyadobacter sp. NIV53 TaxID=2861765 RepID=UPI001C8733E8|nr:ketopantoate reductase C-terminal domain-containing protein [Dyadobacter sp. NIV53]